MQRNRDQLDVNSHDIKTSNFICRTVYFVVVFLILFTPTTGLPIELSYENTVSVLVERATRKTPELLFENRNQKLYLYKEKQKCVVLLLHGLYQSPIDQIGLAEHFFNLGCNVVAPLLEGHWEKNKNAFYLIDEQTWIQQVEAYFGLVKNLGDKVFISGHSTGGLLGFYLALKHPKEIAALVLFAPALKLLNKTIWLAQLGGLFNLVDPKTTNIDLDYDLYEKPAHAGVLVHKLNQLIFERDQSKRREQYKNYSVPTLIFSTKADGVISHDEILQFKAMKCDLVKLYSYSQDSGIYHDNIQRGPLDVVAGAPLFWMNSEFEAVKTSISEFLMPFLN
jgi:alpha-beta hydrolase superfamily lysophospholipase